MRDLVLEPRDTPRRRAILAPSPLDERPNPVLAILRSMAEAAVVAATAIGRRAIAMPFATVVIVVSSWGACAVLGNIAGQARPHPAPMFAQRASEPAPTALALAPRAPSAPVVAAPLAQAPASPAPVAAPVPLPPSRDIAAIIAESAPPARAAASSTGPGANDLVRDLQQLLAQRGLYSGAVDGLMGTRTERAIRQAETTLGLPETGRASERLLERLRASERRVATR